MKKQAAPIPRRIRVGTKMYSVEVVETMRKRADMGRVYQGTGLIQLGARSNIDGRKFTPAQMSETFWHELVHAILYQMQHRLHDDEPFVHEFAKHLSRAINSAKFK